MAQQVAQRAWWYKQDALVHSKAADAGPDVHIVDKQKIVEQQERRVFLDR